MESTKVSFPDEEELMHELAVILKDEFVATVQRSERGLTLRFAEGEAWDISVKRA